MLGAVIGDLAAWTWEHDHESFYPKLVSDKAVLSDLGRAALNAASKNLLSENTIEFSPVDNPAYGAEFFGQNIMRCIVCAWIDDESYPERETLKGMHLFHCCDKEEAYVRTFITRIITCLRKGKTKNQVQKEVPVFESLFHGHDGDELRSCVFQAWTCFSQGFDFISCIHNAMKCTENRHLISAITGAFASAMYGNENIFLKKKFAQKRTNSYYLIDSVRYAIGNSGYRSTLVNKMLTLSNERRCFYPKNNARTNVELHHFESVFNPFSFIAFTEEEKGKILRAFSTDWDNRYGFYLDDGWIYSYRSFVLIGRFQLVEQSEGWHIENLQDSREMDYLQLCNAVCNALYSCRIHKKAIGNIAIFILEMKYFDGRNHAPTAIKGTVSEKFWYGEKMFLSTHQDMAVWRQRAAETRQAFKGIKKKQFSKYSDYKLGIMMYIEMLFTKSDPTDDLSWIYEY